MGIIHRNLTIEQQASEVDKVKRSESGMIVDPITMSPEEKISDALEVMRRYRISGVPVTKNKKLVGILTNRDLRFETRTDIPISEVMTRENLITVPVGTTLSDAEAILHQHRIEKLLVVDDQYNLKGLITVKDIQKRLKYPTAAKDAHGRLRVGAAIGATGDYLERAQEMVRDKADLLAIDSAHGHSTRVIEAIKRIKAEAARGRSDCRQCRHLRWRLRTGASRSGRHQGWHWTGFYLYYAHRHRRRSSADHRNRRGRARCARQRCAHHCRWRHQVLR